tara:strand:+ start:747 stop:1112 length:366 start_codon:yes stop_codon:yes gene_type:complete
MNFIFLSICKIKSENMNDMKVTVYHRKDFKTKPVMKQEYKELVKFCDDLLIDEERKDKEIIELKRQNLKLIQAVDILNKTVKQDIKIEKVICDGCGKSVDKDEITTYYDPPHTKLCEECWT